MKKIKYLLFTAIMMFAFTLTVSAASFNVKASASTVTIGNSVNITVNVSGAAGWEYCVNYNQDVFKLTSAGSDTGGACVKTGSTLTGYASVTYKFQALKSGTGNFSVSGQAYDDDGNALQSSAGSVNVTAKTKEEIQASYSSNANLRVLEVVGYTLTPEFNKDTTEYTLDVDGEVESVQINAFLEDKTATVTPIDVVSLTEGTNKFTITVTAQNGKKKNYNLTITRAEENPIEVEVNGKKYTVVTKKDVKEVPAGFIASTITIGDKEVPAYTSETSNITIVLLKDEDTNIDFFLYQNGKYLPFNQVTSNQIIIIPIEPSKELKNFNNKKTITINDKNIDVYYDKTDSKLVLIYGKNIISGEENWYYYDIDEGTMLKYAADSNTDTIPLVEDKKENSIDLDIITLIFASISGVAIIIIIVLSLINSKLKAKNEEMYNYIENKIKEKSEKKFTKIADKEKNEDLVELDHTNDIKVEETEEVTEPENTEEIIEEEIEEKPLKKAKEVKKAKAKKIKKQKEATIVSDTDILNNIAASNDQSFDDEEEEEETTEQLSRKELKLLKKREKELAKKARREFLDDKTFDESAFDIYETETLSVVDENVKDRKKK